MSEEQKAFECFAVVEIFGHRRLAGRVSEQTIAGAGFFRVEIPRADGTFLTKFENPKSVYELSPCSEEIARAVAMRLDGIEPIKPMDWKPQLPAHVDDDGEMNDPEY